jgi:hypothetical protein
MQLGEWQHQQIAAVPVCLFATHAWLDVRVKHAAAGVDVFCAAAIEVIAAALCLMYLRPAGLLMQHAYHVYLASSFAADCSAVPAAASAAVLLSTALSQCAQDNLQPRLRRLVSCELLHCCIMLLR